MGAMSSLSVFLQPISEATGWSRSGISSAASINWLCMGLGSFGWGALSDRFGARVVVLSGGLLLGLGLVTASQAATLGQFQLLWGLLVGLGAGSFYAPLTAVTMRWFTRHRVLAVALVSAGLGLGSMILGPLARWLTSTWDWRVAMLAIGDLAWLVIVPCAFLVRNPPPLAAAAASSAAPVAGRELSIGEALRTPQFAAIAFTHFACCAAHSGPIFHMVTHAIDRGVPAMAAATVLGVAGLSSLGGRIVCGIVADRVGAKRTLLVGLSVQAIAVIFYVVTQGLVSFYALAVVFGAAYGGVMPLYAVLVREYFGERIMGAAFGAVGLVATFGMALGAWVGGLLYDASGSYSWLFVGSFAIGLGAVAIAATFRPPVAPPLPATLVATRP
jgi:MFS family permease